MSLWEEIKREIAYLQLVNNSPLEENWKTQWAKEQLKPIVDELVLSTKDKCVEMIRARDSYKRGQNWRITVTPIIERGKALRADATYERSHYSFEGMIEKLVSDPFSHFEAQIFEFQEAEDEQDHSGGRGRL